jgi:hypothetical protein
VIILQLYNNVVGGYKIFYGGVIYLVLLLVTTMGVYYRLNRLIILKESTKIIGTLIFTLLQIIYSHKLIKIIRSVHSFLGLALVYLLRIVQKLAV